MKIRLRMARYEWPIKKKSLFATVFNRVIVISTSPYLHLWSPLERLWEVVVCLICVNLFHLSGMYEIASSWKIQCSVYIICTSLICQSSYPKSVQGIRESASNLQWNVVPSDLLKETPYSLHLACSIWYQVTISRSDISSIIGEIINSL